LDVEPRYHRTQKNRRVVTSTTLFGVHSTGF
jgi:hypothetical protein